MDREKSNCPSAIVQELDLLFILPDTTTSYIAVIEIEHTHSITMP